MLWRRRLSVAVTAHIVSHRQPAPVISLRLSNPHQKKKSVFFLSGLRHWVTQYCLYNFLTLNHRNWSESVRLPLYMSTSMHSYIEVEVMCNIHSFFSSSSCCLPLFVVVVAVLSFRWMRLPACHHLSIEIRDTWEFVNLILVTFALKTINIRIEPKTRERLETKWNGMQAYCFVSVATTTNGNKRTLSEPRRSFSSYQIRVTIKYTIFGSMAVHSSYHPSKKKVFFPYLENYYYIMCAVRHGAHVNGNGASRTPPTWSIQTVRTSIVMIFYHELNKLAERCARTPHNFTQLITLFCFGFFYFQHFIINYNYVVECG